MWFCPELVKQFQSHGFKILSAFCCTNKILKVNTKYRLKKKKVIQQK